MFQKFHRLFNQYKTLYVNAQQYSGYEILKQIGIQAGAPVIVFKGGELQMMSEDSHYLESMIWEGIARAAGELRASVVDGGTNSGMLAILNAALREHHHPGYYIGVAPGALTCLPNQPNNGHLMALGDAHTHFVLVEGDNWGDEVPVMQDLINALTEKLPYLVISVNNRGIMEDKGERNKGDENNTTKIDYEGIQKDKIFLQLRYPPIKETAGPQNMTRGGTFLAIEIEAEPEKLANKIKYFLKTYSSIRKDS